MTAEEPAHSSAPQPPVPPTPDPGSPGSGPRSSRPQSAAEARAEVEAQRAQRRAERKRRLAEAFGGEVPGRWVPRASWVATAVLAIVTLVAAVDPDRFVGPFFVVAMALFLAGSALFALDVVLAAARSRTHEMGIGGLFFLAGCAPRSVAVSLNASLGVAVVVSVAGAAVRPFTPLAFGVLAPVAQLALSGLWGVRHGHFPPRRDEQGLR